MIRYMHTNYILDETNLGVLSSNGTFAQNPRKLVQLHCQLTIQFIQVTD